MNQIEIYQTKNKQVEVKFEGDSVWLNQYQLSELFSTDRTSVLKHLKNIFKTKELDEKITCAKFAQVQKEGNKTVKREILHYNLDAIISVGYRINSKRGTQFRQWATQRLKDHLVKGYTLNEKRLSRLVQNMQQLKEAVKVFQQVGNTDELSASEAKPCINDAG